MNDGSGLAEAPGGVDVLALQPDGFAPAQSAVGEHVDEHLRVGMDRTEASSALGTHWFSRLKRPLRQRICGPRSLSR